MIRFECETCRRPLRAPDDLVGKRGRCARCGAVNRVPSAAGRAPRRQTAIVIDQPVNVEVKRATGTSPFRSTADVELAAGALGTTFVALEGAAAKTQFAAVDGPALLPAQEVADVGRGAVDFLDHLSAQIGELTEATTESSNNEPIAPLTALAPARRRNSMDTLHLASLPLRAQVREQAAQDDPPSARNVLVAVLAVGVIIGFVAGVVFMKWLG